MKYCSVCWLQIYETEPYLYMDATGESMISYISFRGSDLIFCPKCTNKLEVFINDLINENKKNNVKVLKKEKIVNISDYIKKK